jgi:hypothetical protein
LDNAGKTTILKKFNGEDVNTISPTLGFNIKTLEHKGYQILIFYSQIFLQLFCSFNETVSTSIFGMWVVKQVFDHIGEITLKAQMDLFGLLTVLTAGE